MALVFATNLTERPIGKFIIKVSLFHAPDNRIGNLALTIKLTIGHIGLAIAQCGARLSDESILFVSSNGRANGSRTAVMAHHKTKIVIPAAAR